MKILVNTELSYAFKLNKFMRKYTSKIGNSRYKNELSTGCG